MNELMTQESKRAKPINFLLRQKSMAVAAHAAMLLGARIKISKEKTVPISYF